MIVRDAESKARLKEWCLSVPCCELCGKRPPNGVRLEPHHLFLRVGGAGSDFRCNVIVTCRACHHAVESSTAKNEAAKQLVAIREKTTTAAILEALWFIRRTPKDSSPERIAAQMRDLPDEVRRLVTVCLNEAGIGVCGDTKGERQ
jgi:hypothetical protein